MGKRPAKRATLEMMRAGKGYQSWKTFAIGARRRHALTAGFRLGIAKGFRGTPFLRLSTMGDAIWVAASGTIFTNFTY
jgi:hypothetical protein